MDGAEHRALVDAVLGVARLATGCIAQRAHTAGQGWKRQRRERLADESERRRCIDEAAVSHEDHRREAGGALERPRERLPEDLSYRLVATPPYGIVLFVIDATTLLPRLVLWLPRMLGYRG